MKYELKTLEHIITVVLNPGKIKPGILNDEFISECKVLAENEMEKVCNQFRVTAFEGHKETALKAYYRKHQAVLVSLADTSFNYLQPGITESISLLTNEDVIINFYKEMARIPNDLLAFISYNFPEYFDNEIKIADAEKWRIIPEIEQDLKRLKTAVKRAALHESLIEIAFGPFEDFLSPASNTNYRDLAYLNEYRHALQHFVDEIKAGNINEMFKEFLLHLNYNSLRFFNYYILTLKEAQSGINATEELIVFYSQHIKLINQQTAKPGLIYKTRLAPIKEQIGSWLCEELYYLEKKQQLMLPIETKRCVETVSSTKIYTRLSVAQLALGVKLLLDAKLIKNNNSTELMRAVARNFRTERQEFISEESLRNKSYNIEAVTINSLRDTVIEFMNLLKGY